jgi:4-aminobutyrate aminotransferase/(S)-3-amino-2-methylpropionate transaminase
MIMDEVQTGCGGTGHFWAYEHFDLPEAPDILTFSKKMQQGGFYYKPAYRVDQVGPRFIVCPRLIMLFGI